MKVGSPRPRRERNKSSKGARILTHGSLFAGIGGFDLGFERAGIQTIWQVENYPYAVKVLERHWPDVKRYGDIKEIRWEDVEVPDIVSGGFPCQPVSVAGKRRGATDERWLWPEFVRCLRILRPRYAVLENVPGILALGFGDVLGDLAESGYDTEWDCIPACAVGANHERDRLFAVAYPQGIAERSGFRPFYAAEVWRGRLGDSRSATAVRDADGSGRGGDNRRRSRAESSDGCTDVPNTAGRENDKREPRNLAPSASCRNGGNSTVGSRREVIPDAEGDGERPGLREGESEAERGRRLIDGGGEMADANSKRCLVFGMFKGSGNEFNQTGNASGARPIISENNSAGEWWTVEPDVGRVAYGVPARVDRLKCLGNAVVPQVAEWIGKLIIEFEKEI